MSGWKHIPIHVTYAPATESWWAQPVSRDEFDRLVEKNRVRMSNGKGAALVQDGTLGYGHLGFSVPRKAGGA